METYDPTWVLELFRERLDPGCHEACLILESLALCTHPVCRCSCGCGDPYFVDPKSPAWKFRTNVTAYRDHTLVILDIMEDWSVGSIEMQRDMPCDLEDMTTVEVE
jgi:hypothetical protein